MAGINWGMAAGGAQDAMQQMLEQRILEEKMALAQRQQQAEEAYRAAQLAEQAAGRGDVNRRFDRTQGFEENKYNDAAPVRAEELTGAKLGNTGKGIANATGQFNLDTAKDERANLDALANDPVLAPVIKLYKAGVKAAPVDGLDPKGDIAFGREGSLIKQRGDQAVRAASVREPTAKYSQIVQGEQNGEPVRIGIRPDGTQEVLTAPEGTSYQTTDPKMAAGAKAELADMMTVESLATSVLKDGQRTNWAGTGGMKMGSMQQWASKNLNTGTKSEVSLRARISNITGTIAKLRGGSALTPQELELIDRYTPTIDDAPVVLEQKLNDLVSFIRTKRENVMNVSKMGLTPSPAATGTGATPPASKFKIVSVQE